MRGRELLGGIACAAAWLLAAPGPAAAELTCARVPQLASEFLHAHVAHRRLTPELESRAIATYVDRLDASRSVLLKSEVAAARASLAGSFERMRKGDCAPLLAWAANGWPRCNIAGESVRRNVSGSKSTVASSSARGPSWVASTPSKTLSSSRTGRASCFTAKPYRARKRGESRTAIACA